jgi:ABC-type polysaccharide/polyol phosphate export permease
MRYVVESANTLLFWAVPICYSFSIIPPEYSEIYQLNPVAALVMGLRSILMDATPPATTLLVKLTLCSFLMFGTGLIVFRRLTPRFYDYL